MQKGKPVSLAKTGGKCIFCMVRGQDPIEKHLTRSGDEVTAAVRSHTTHHQTIRHTSKRVIVASPKHANCPPQAHIWKNVVSMLHFSQVNFNLAYPPLHIHWFKYLSTCSVPGRLKNRRKEAQSVGHSGWFHWYFATISNFQ